MLKKILFIFITAFLLVGFSFINNNDTIATMSNSMSLRKNTGANKSSPDIISVSPSKCQQYIIGKPSIHIKYKDEDGIDTSSIKLFVNYKDVTKDCKITNEKILYTPTKKFKRGSQIVKFEVSDVLKNKKSFEWYFTVGTPIYNHYRGLLHAHTSASDGHGTYSDAYYMAREKAKLDFFAITEHSNMLDNYLDCTLEDASASSKWNDLIKTRNKFILNDNFIALSGFEMTYPHHVQDNVGHINIFNSNGFTCSEHPDMNLDNFYKLIYNQDGLIGQFNHPCDEFGTFNDFKYSPYGDSVISLLEVGNGYNPDITKNRKAHDMYQYALDKGWHLAPTCGQDNHRIDFGVANEFRTVVLSTDLSKDAIYDSLKKMRVYSTEDKNIKIDYTINDLPIGSTLRNPSKLNFSICAIDKDYNDKVKEIQVISNKGEIVKRKKYNSNLAKLEFTLKPEKNKFYYVKVIQNLNKTSLSAPIWIK